MAQATSRVFIKANGLLLRTKEGASIQGGGLVSEAVVTDSGFVDHKDNIVASEVTATLVHNAETDMESLRLLKNVTLSYETDTGVGWAISGAFVTELGALSAGEFDITFNGPPAVRV
jgi:hypothetical protein